MSRCTCFLIAFLSLAPTGAVLGDIIFVDSFDLDPSLNGWTEEVTGSGGGTIVPNNVGQVSFVEGGGTGSATLSITRTVSTIGFTNISVDLSAFQSNTDFESTDFLEISVDVGTGFQSILRDVAVWNGVDDRSGDDGFSNTTSTPTGDLFIDLLTSPGSPSSANNAGLQIRVTAVVNTSAEIYLLDNLSLGGTAGPEPSSATLVSLISGFGIFMRRRRMSGRQDAGFRCTSRPRN